MVEDTAITSRQEATVIALVSTKTIRAAARECGVSETTIYRWLREDASFQASYREARRASVQQAIARLQHGASQAAQTLLNVANSRTAKDSERVSAARAVLDYSLRGVEIEDLAARVAALEGKISDESK